MVRGWFYRAQVHAPGLDDFILRDWIGNPPGLVDFNLRVWIGKSPG